MRRQIKVSDVVRQEVPEGVAPDALPEPPGLAAVPRRPMPLGGPTRRIRGVMRRQFTALNRSLEAKLETSGLVAEVARDASDFLRTADDDAKAAVGRGGQPLGEFRRREIERLFSRPPFQAVSTLIRSEVDEWALETTAALDPEYANAYTTGGKAAQRKIGIRANFDLRNPGILQALDERANLLTGGIGNDIFDRMRTVIGEEFYLKGQGVPSVARSLQSEFSWLNRVRAETIAHQESLTITSDAQHTVYAASGVEFKRWITTLDGNERPTHFEAHGQLVKIDEPFIVGGSSLFFPGDPAGETAEIMRCRCDHIPVVMADQQFQGSTVWNGDVAPDEFARAA